MESKKSYLMYVFVLLFIGIIVVFFVIPSNGEKVLNCTLKEEDNYVTYFDIKSYYNNGKFDHIVYTMKLDIENDWLRRNDYVYSIDKDSYYFTDMGFTYDVNLDNDNKMVIAEFKGNKDNLSKDLLYFQKNDVVEEQLEMQGYECELEDVK